MQDKIIKIAGSAFLAAGCLWFLLNGVLSYEMALGTKADFEHQKVELQKQYNDQMLTLGIIYDNLKSLKNADVDAVLAKYNVTRK